MNHDGLFSTYNYTYDVKAMEAFMNDMYMMIAKPIFPEPFQHLDGHLDLGLYSDDDIDTLIDFITDYLRNRRPSTEK